MASKYYKQLNQFLFLQCQNCKEMWKPILPIDEIRRCYKCRSVRWDGTNRQPQVVHARTLAQAKQLFHEKEAHKDNA